MKYYTSDNPVFSDKILIVERADLVNYANKTESEKQLLQNDLVLHARLKQCLGDDPEHGDSQNLIVTFDSGDSETANKWTDTETIHSGEEHKSLMAKVSTMVKNVRYLYKLLGTTDISKIGDGTVTGAIKKVNKALKPIDTENHVENMTSINQITSIGFWKISAIDSNYASSIGIDNNTGDFYAIVSNYTGNGTDHFDFGDLLLFSPRLKSYHYTVDVWNGDARARLVLTNDNILTTKEQINANTDTRNVAGATAMKEMFRAINSNLDAIFSNEAYSRLKFLGIRYLKNDEELGNISKIFQASKATAYAFLNQYVGICLIIGFCYGAEQQDSYGAQIKLTIESDHIIQVRSLYNGIWTNWVVLDSHPL